MRYLVLPRRPEETGGWSAERLAAIVGRNAMIGTGLVTVPGAAEG
jgi:nitrile hydratase